MSLAIAYQMKKKAKMAEGGMPCRMCEGGSCPKHMSMGGEANYQSEDRDEDIVGRIMKARMMSKGGIAANADHGEDDDELADFQPNQFDELAKDDDLESSYTGKDSGDEIGDRQEDEDRHDLVSRIMMARKMKDRMPKVGVGHYGT